MSKSKKAKKNRELIDPTPVVEEVSPEVDPRILADRRSAQARLRGYASAASLTPEQRSERARRAGKASAAKRAKEREALGLTNSGGSRYASKPQPSATELSDWLEAFDAANPDGHFSYDERRRGALILMRRHIAELALGKLS